MIFWDLEQKNKIKDFSYLGQPVTKSKVSPNGMYVAYALGNDWTEGVWSLEKRLQPKVAVHVV
jgi:WD40 repeat protein